METRDLKKDRGNEKEEESWQETVSCFQFHISVCRCSTAGLIQHTVPFGLPPGVRETVCVWGECIHLCTSPYLMCG